MAFTKITAAGIGSTETVTLDGLSVINDGSFGGNVSVGGTLTYEDVTNIDSVGLITARAGVVVGSGITLSKDGDVFFTGIATGNGSGLTALNASNLASGTVPTARLGSGTASSSTFLAGDSSFKTVTGTTINTNADNRVITGSDTANTLNGESTLTFNNGQLDVTQTTSSSDAKLVIRNSNTPGSGSLRLEFHYGTGSSEGTDRFRFGYIEGFRAGGSNDGGLKFGTKPDNASNPTHRLTIDSSGHVVPASNDTYDLGSSSLRWRDIYTGDLHLSNQDKVGGNDVDGTWGDWTIQEGESDLFLKNNRSGKKYKFNLTEVS